LNHSKTTIINRWFNSNTMMMKVSEIWWF